MKKLVLSYEYQSPSLQHQLLRDNDIARQINHSASLLHMRYLQVHLPSGGHKQHLCWLRDLKEQAFDRLTDRYYVPMLSDKDIVTVDESNWARQQPTNIGLNYMQNKSLQMVDDEMP
jgi:hypothetical protein